MFFKQITPVFLFTNKKVLMNLKTFKKLCLKASTKKADEVHDYFIKLEEVLHKTLYKQCNELMLQLQENNLLLQQNNALLQKKEKEQIDTWLKIFDNQTLYFSLLN